MTIKFCILVFQNQVYTVDASVDSNFKETELITRYRLFTRITTWTTTISKDVEIT